MFYRNSRYFKLTDLSTRDARGRVANGKVLRRLPSVDGRFQHVVDGNDRLDNLAHKYYKKSSMWWHICDANPAFLSPRALIGKDSTRTEVWNISWAGSQPPWQDVRNRLMAEPGIEKVMFGDVEKNVPDEQRVDGSFLFPMAQSLLTDIETSILNQQLTASLDTALQAGGVIMGSVIHFTALADDHWQFTDQLSKSVYNLYHQGVNINVFEVDIFHNWTLRVQYNQQNLCVNEIIPMIENLHSPGFKLSLPSEVQRVGKPIIIPPMVVVEGA